MGRLVLVALNGPPSFTTYAASGCRAAVGLSSAAAARPRMCGSLAVTRCPCCLMRAARSAGGRGASGWFCRGFGVLAVWKGSLLAVDRG